MSESGDSEVIRRRKPRKGTRSCYDCRRRKTRCVFKSATDSICSACESREVPCIEQEVGRVGKSSFDRRENLRERVARLEKMLTAARDPAAAPLLVSGPAENSSRRYLDLTVETVSEGPNIGNLATRAAAPVMSLFDNAVLTTKSGVDESGAETTSKSHVNPIDSSQALNEPINDDSTLGLETLSALIPNYRSLSTIFQAGGGWWNSWRKMYPSICFDSEDITLQEYDIHFPPNFDYSSLGFSNSKKATIQHYVSAVNRFICSEDNFMSSLEGIEVILLQSKLCVNCGQARKAWLWIRRGFAYAELVGLADDKRLLKRANFSVTSHRRESILSHLIEVDRQLSLILGLPFNFINISAKLNSELETRTGNISSGQYRRKLFTIAESIIGLNHDASNLSLITNQKLDQDLEDLAELMSDKWWDLSDMQSHTPDMGDICDRLFTQFWHHQIKSSLHLPFMLRSVTKPRYQSNRIACFTASREMLRIFQILRGCDCTRFIHYCQVMDFQAFTAAVILILGLLGYQSTSHNQILENIGDEWAIIDLTVENLRRAGSEPENSVARQSHQALETLRQARHGPYLEPRKRITEIVVPYFGVLFICLGEKYTEVGTVSRSMEIDEQSVMQGISHQDSMTQHDSLSDEAIVAFNTFVPTPLNDYSHESLGISDFDNFLWPAFGNTDLDQQWGSLDSQFS